MNDAISSGTPDAPSMVIKNVNATTEQDDPLVSRWMDRIKRSERHWGPFHKRVKYNRSLVRGIDDKASPQSPEYNKKRANLIKSTISVVLSKVYAKNPEMAAEPTNKSKSLRKFVDTVSGVTQAMLEDAKLKQKAKRSVRAAMTCTFAVVKVQYQRDIRTDPIIVRRIQDAQDNILHIEGLLAQMEGDEAQRHDQELKKRELEQAIASLELQKETIAGEGIVIDNVRTDRILFDDAIDDIMDYRESAWIIEKIPMRKSSAMGQFPGFDFTGATTFKIDPRSGDPTPEKSSPYSLNMAGDQDIDAMIMVYECWHKTDNTIYTLIDGCRKQFAREPYSPEFAGEVWWPYFVLPFGVVDGEFVTQSLVDDLEKLEVEHNETRDKFATVRKNIRPHFIVSGDVTDKEITTRLHPELGEIIVVTPAAGGRLQDNIQQGAQLQIDPAVFDTTPISYDIETVSGLQEAARSVITTPKTATEAQISDQSLGARVGEFRDQIEDWLSEIAQYSSELCLLAMTDKQVEQIMGGAEPITQEQMMQAQLTGMPPVPVLPYEWPQDRSPQAVFNLVQMKVRAGSTQAPNKLAMQESWTRALPLFTQMIGTIMQVDATGGDSTPYRELVKETASRFDESLDVERFLPPKPLRPAMPVPGAMPAGPGVMAPAPMPGGSQIPGGPPAMPRPGGQPGEQTLQ